MYSRKVFHGSGKLVCLFVIVLVRLFFVLQRFQLADNKVYIAQLSHPEHCKAIQAAVFETDLLISLS